MKALHFLLIFAASPLCAHVMSMSTGDVTVNGARAHYELRMPLYEITHIKSPGSSLFEHVHFATSGQAARLLERSCREEPSQGNYVCSGDYEFPIPVERLDVECDFHSVTVPNHVHLLRALKDGKIAPFGHVDVYEMTL